MMDMHSKYDNMHMNIMFSVLIYIKNHVIIGISKMMEKKLSPSCSHARMHERARERGRE